MVHGDKQRQRQPVEMKNEKKGAKRTQRWQRQTHSHQLKPLIAFKKEHSDSGEAQEHRQIEKVPHTNLCSNEKKSRDKSATLVRPAPNREVENMK